MEQSQRTAQGELAAVVSPVRESLDRVDSKIQELETARAGAYAALQEQVRALIETQAQLRSETGKAGDRAADARSVRGHWGEIQLRRVVEMAGMLDHCDFIDADDVHSGGGPAAAGPAGAPAGGQDDRRGCEDAAGRLPAGDRGARRGDPQGAAWRTMRGRCART